MNPVALRVREQQQQVDTAEPKADYEHLSVADALKQLGVSMTTGLTAAEAKQRPDRYGFALRPPACRNVKGGWSAIWSLPLEISQDCCHVGLPASSG
jgi:hypothetical protein